MLWAFLGDYLPEPGVALDWVPRFFVHLRGEQEAARIWQEAQPLRRE
jgi:hypothetical protein